MLLGSFSLLAWRIDRLKAQGELDSVLSRETVFLLNNVFLVAAAFTVFFGTIFPLLSEAVRGTKLSVGAPFFNLVNIPIFLGLLLLMGIGPLIAWRRASADNLRRNFVKPVLAGILAAAILRLVGVGNALVLLCMGLVVFVTGTMVLDFYRAVRARRRTARGGSTPPVACSSRRTGATGASSSISASSSSRSAWPARRPGRSTPRPRSRRARACRWRDTAFASTVSRSPRSRITRRSPRAFTVTNGRSLGVLHPAKKFYPQEQTPIAGVDYRLGLVEDLYLVLGDYAKDGSHATIKIQVNRMVSWLWIGGFVLTLGASLAILPDQRRSA